METIEITVGIGCPMRCSYCPQDALIKNYYPNTIPELSFDNFKTMIQKIPKSCRIDFSGMAEPFLNKKTPEMIKYADEQGYKIAVYTTAVGLTREGLELIKDIEFDTFVLHLPDKEMIARIPLNSYYIEILQRIKECGFKNFNLMTMGTIRDEAKEIFGYVSPNSMHSRAGNVKTLRTFKNVGKLNCDYIKTPRRGVILPDGRVLLCCNDYGMKHVLGNLLTDSYEDLYNSEEYKKIVKAMDEEDSETICRYCRYVKRM